MQKGRKGFDFGFAADDDEEDDGAPAVRTVPAARRQEFPPDTSAKIRPAQYPAGYPNAESFVQANASVASGAGSILDPGRGMGDSAALLSTASASQRLKELNALDVPTTEDVADAEIFTSEAPDIDFDLKN